MATQRVIFEGESLLRLLTAYFDGKIPLDAKLLFVGAGQQLQRWIGLWVESEQWGSDGEVEGGHGLVPLHLRYEGRRNLSWTKRDGNEIDWGREGEDFEIPR